MESYFKTIRVLEPYGGWISNYLNSELRHENLDTGFGNRLFHWLNAYRISKKYNFEYKILVEKIWWPELEYIELPNTEYFHSEYSFEEYHLYKQKFIGNSLPITNKMFKDFINGESILDDFNHWYVDFDYSMYIHPFPKLKLKFDLKFNFKNILGIHIRRGNGINFPILGEIYKDEIGVYGKVSEEDLSIMNWKSQFTLNKTDTPYIPNEYYYKWIDLFLAQSEKNNIYISYDIPDEYIKPFYLKYKNRVITKYDIMENINYNKLQWPYANTFKNVVDLFCLSSSSYLVGHPKSSWSFFSKMYSNLEFPKLNLF